MGEVPLYWGCTRTRTRTAPALYRGTSLREIGILLPNNQRKHRTLHIQKDVLPWHCASYCAPCQPLLRAFSGWIRSPPPNLLPNNQHHHASSYLLDTVLAALTSSFRMNSIGMFAYVGLFPLRPYPETVELIPTLGALFP